MIVWWWLIVAFGVGVLFGMIVMACCAAAGCTDWGRDDV